MKLLSAQQIHQWDAFTIEHEPIASIDLMERAAQGCTDFIIENNFILHDIKIFCGKGNNGGDGLAIARQLIHAGFQPFIYILEFGAKGTNDFQINLQRLHEITKDIVFIQSTESLPFIDEHDVVIDALFGSGLNRPLKDISYALVQHINQSNATVIAIDVPSGMFIDDSSKNFTVIKATHTLTFQTTKPCLLLAENSDFFGEVHVLNIGLSQEFLQIIDTTFHLIDDALIQSIYKPRKQFSHKGTYGHALLIAGNKGKMGAAVLCAHASVVTGAGLTTINIPEAQLNIMQTALPEAMCVLRDEEIDYDKYNALGIGPGLGTDNASESLVQQTLQSCNKPMVIDADALNIIAKNNWLHLVPANSIITPHPKEFERLFGATENNFARIQKAIEASLQFNIIIVLKDAHTLIIKDGKGWFNNTGNAGLAKGGSGDVLTGIITALLVQHYQPLQAALFGVFLHGLAADEAIKNIAMESLAATNVIHHISNAYKKIEVL